MISSSEQAKPTACSVSCPRNCFRHPKVLCFRTARTGRLPGSHFAVLSRIPSCLQCILKREPLIFHCDGDDFWIPWKVSDLKNLSYSRIAKRSGNARQQSPCRNVSSSRNRVPLGKAFRAKRETGWGTGVSAKPQLSFSSTSRPPDVVLHKRERPLVRHL